MTTKSLLIAAAVIALALSPSVGECLTAHREDHPDKGLLYGWVAMVIILAFVAGEEVLSAA